MKSRGKLAKAANNDNRQPVLRAIKLLSLIERKLPCSPHTRGWTVTTLRRHRQFRVFSTLPWMAVTKH